MSTWLEQFAARLNDINATRGSKLRGGTEMDAIYGVLSQRINDAHLAQYNTELASSNRSTGGHIWDDIKSGGGRILDVLSRANYASANTMRSLAKDERDAKAKGNDVGIFGRGVDYNWTDALKAGWRGLEGKDKTTYADVLKDQGVGGKTAGVLGFVGDVALDPTTYICAGAIKSVANGGF